MRMQTRGAGSVAKSLNVRGEEILTNSQPCAMYIWVRDCTYLVGCVADADIKVWKLGLHDISKNHIQTLLRRSALKTLGNFSRHARIQFHCNNLLGVV